MNEAVWALIGIALGAVLQFLSSLWTEQRADRRAEAERQERREARLFDARRATYEEFQSIARRLLDHLWEYHSGLLNVSEPDYDFADDLLRALGPVRLYASPETSAAAEALLKAINAYGSDAGADAPSNNQENRDYEQVDNRLRSFAVAARSDLGGAP